LRQQFQRGGEGQTGAQQAGKLTSEYRHVVGASFGAWCWPASRQFDDEQIVALEHRSRGAGIWRHERAALLHAVDVDTAPSEAQIGG
jgi:hypothetical protein